MSDPVVLPETASVLAFLASLEGPHLADMSAADMRETYLKLGAAFDEPADPSVRTVDFTGAGIPLRGYFPGKAEAGPVIVYMHGGGWVIGDLETHDRLCRQLCNESGVAIVAVDYRLAPEHVFPACVEDAFAATQWIAANAAELRIDPKRLAVGGDSAGGNLSAVVSLMARDAEGPALRLQLLIYPAVDFRMNSPSFASRGDVLPLTKQAVQWFGDHYLGKNPGDRVDDWRASPIRAASLAGLPPAHVITGGYDVLCDEGQAYADALEKAGVPVERAHFPGMIHGFITMGRFVQAANTAIAGCAAALKRALA